MHTARRLYVYLLSGVSLGVLLVGLNLLLSLLFGVMGLDRGPFAAGSGEVDREQLSLAAALTVVGMLVWGVHWWLAERSVRAGGSAAEEERSSALRGLYLSATLAALLAFGVVAAGSLLTALAVSLLGAGPSRADLGGAAATLLVTAVAWLYHAAVRRRDLRAPLSSRAAVWPRLYLYGAALVAVLLLAMAMGRLLGLALEAVVGPPALGSRGGVPFAAGREAASVIVWGAVWLGHWWYATRIAASGGWRGTADRSARLRLAYFVAAATASVLGLLWFVAAAVQAAVVDLVGVEALAISGSGSSLAVAVGAPLLAAAPWAVAWWLHRRWLITESLELDSETRAATADRLDAAGAAAVGLAFLGVGVAWLLGLGLDVVLGGSRTAVASSWEVELARYLSLALVGLAPWAWAWMRLQRRHRARPADEAASTVRRTYLLGTLAVSILASIGSLAVVLYRLFGSLFGVSFAGNDVSALSTPTGVLLVTATVAAYHGLVLLRDQRLRTAEAEVRGEPPKPSAAGARSALVLTGPAGADMGAALLALRRHLPSGYTLETQGTDDESGR